MIAVARPHQAALVGEKALLDGSRSYSDSPIARFEWTFTDGGNASGQSVERIYSQPGTFSEILKITDDRGHTDYDFETVRGWAVNGAQGAHQLDAHSVICDTDDILWDITFPDLAEHGIRFLRHRGTDEEFCEARAHSEQHFCIARS